MAKESIITQIENEQAEIAILKEKTGKRKRRFIIVLCIFVVLMVASVFAGKSVSQFILSNKYAKLLSAAESADSVKMVAICNEDLLNYRDSIGVFEKNCLGNSNRIIQMQKGKVYIAEDCTYQAVNGKLERLHADDVTTVYENDVSYINKYNDGILFRDDTTKLLHSCTDEKDEVILPDYKCGETIVFNDSIYFINLENNKLYASVSGEQPVQVFETDIDSFAIAGNYIFVHTTNNKLISYTADGNMKHSLDNIRDFYLCDKLYAGCLNGNIISMDFRFANSKKECEETGILLAIGNNGIYIQNGNTVSLVHDGNSLELANNVSICKGVYENSETEIVLSVIIIDENGLQNKNITCSI